MFLPDALTVPGLTTSMKLLVLCVKKDVPAAEGQKMSVLFERSGAERPALVNWMRKNDGNHHLAG
jgi:hypothetical protein